MEYIYPFCGMWFKRKYIIYFGDIYIYIKFVKFTVVFFK